MPYDLGEWEDGAEWHGTWNLEDGKLRLQGPTSPYTPNLVRKVAAFDVPDSIGDSALLRLAWQVLNGSSLGADDELRSTYAAGTLQLIHIADVVDAAVRTEIRCTRT
ncbi:hypothetical protein [Streptomyces sp. NPDC086838]|uniref:hypothetical protein n=1 Tax=Streptomyces sp. NPDC086838 TaxID=3365762 RepID=UPI00380ED97D